MTRELAAAERLRELIDMTSRGRALVPRDEALFAARHDTPEGQIVLQQLHDVAARGGAVCNAAKTTMASRHEADAGQQVHDMTVENGAVCSTTARARFTAADHIGALRASIDRLRSENETERATLARDRVWGTPSSPEKIRELLQMTHLGRQTLQGLDQPRG